MKLPIEIDKSKIEAFCKKWKIIEFSFFGSVLRDDFRPDSDVDVLVTFDPNAKWKLWEVDLAEKELQEILGRSVDLIEREAVEQSKNPIRRKAILSSAQSYYVA
jgi:uncharacterized protein